MRLGFGILLTILAAPLLPLQANESALALLEAHCLSCHQPKHAKSALDLSSRATLLAGGDGGAAVNLGRPETSLLLKRVTHAVKPGMPYKKEKLSDEQIAILSRWVADGAPYSRALRIPSPSTQPTLWSLQPLTRPALPALGQVASPELVRNEIDLFIQTKLAVARLVPSAEANRRTLVRRLYHDLLGLPPTPREVQTFINDPSPDAYERLIDQLLASPHYGERMARHWLDVAHYADTHGYDKDKRRDNAWHYRDYVITSLNADKPFNRFIEEQIAGDVLFPSDPDALIATGFLAAGPWDFVGHVELGADSTDGKIARTLDRDDMLSNVIGTFCSMTVHCARCHDHKFDPIPRDDYYRLQAVFAGVTRGDRDIPDPKRLAFLAQRDALQKQLDAATPPELKAIQSQIASANQKSSTKRSPTNGYHSAISNTSNVAKWVQLDLGREFPIDQIILHPARPTDFVDTPGFGFPERFKIEASTTADFANPILIEDHTTVDFANPGDVPLVITTKLSARHIRITAAKLWHRTNDYVFALGEVQVLSEGRNIAANATITALDSIEAGRWSTHHLIDNFNSRSALTQADPAQIAALDQRRRDIESSLSPEKRLQLSSLSSQITQLDAKLKALPAPQKVYTILPAAPVPIHILHRGDVNSLRDLVPPGALSAAVPAINGIFESSPTEGHRRAALAKWITHPQNPLTARSIANRMWQYHFGRALAPTPNDFGHQGTPPTHPELLDYLAWHLATNNWQLKPLHKLILMSHTYRQSASIKNQNSNLENPSDSDNILLSHFPRRRLSAEEIRDALLAISGKLDRSLYGRPFNTFDFKDDHSPHYDYATFAQREEPQTFRRSLYRFTVRSVPDPLMDALDCADPNISTPVRNSTNTALQALVMLNDPFLLRQSHYLATAIQNDPDPIASLHVRILLRAPTAEEHRLLSTYSQKHGLANTARLLFNTNEFTFIE